MKTGKIPSYAVVAVVLLAIVAVALILRVALPYGQVFVKDWVKMTGVDAYYYMRLVDNLMKHFPQLTPLDPYLQFPGGAATGSSPDFFAYMMGGIIWLMSLGQADQHMVDVIAVYIPPVLAVLTVLMVFFIGRSIGGNWMGLLAAGLLAIMPGEFLNRSLLGYTDHHIAEVLFSTGLMMFAFLAVRQSEGKSLDEMVRQGLKGIGKPVLYGLLGGLFMGLYMLTWAGALLFALVLFVFIIIQSAVEHLQGRSVDYIGLLGVCIFATALAMYLPAIRSMLVAASLVIGLALSIVLAFVSRYMAGRHMKPVLFPAAVAIIGVLSVTALAFTAPGILQSMTANLLNIFAWHTETTVMEMQPLLLQQGNFTFMVAIGNYMLSFFFSLAAILILVFQVFKKGRSDCMLLLVWSLIILLAALSMRRFAYYYAVNVALLAGYICWLAIEALLRKRAAGEQAPVAKPVQRGKKKASRQAVVIKPKARRIGAAVGLALVCIFVLVYYPNIGPLPGGDKPAIDLATRPLFAPGNEWCRAMDWMRNNTPEPYGDAAAYYGIYKPANEKGGFKSPPGAYGVLSWWDYGYWISRIGHRPPATNPGTGHLGTAYFFTAQDGPTAARVINNLGTRYVIADREIAAYDGKFHALASLSNSSYSDYYDVFYQEQNGQYSPVILYYPEYYRSMISRLYNFDGRAVSPDSVSVISYSERKGQDNRKYKVIAENKRFGSYAEAQKFIRENPAKNYLVVGDNPYKSPVPLEELANYSIVYGAGTASTAGAKPSADIKIFEYTRDAVPVAGNWEGGRKASPGLWQPGGHFIIDKSGAGELARIGPFGYASDVPVTGDWNGDGRTEVGVWRPGDLSYYLDFNGDGNWDETKGDRKVGPFGFDVSDIPVTGDWNGDGEDEVGVWHHDLYSREGYYYLDVDGDGTWNPAGKDVKFGPFGEIGDVPMSGDWNGDSRDEVAIWDPADGYFYLDMDWDGKWDASKGDLKLGPYGRSHDTPVRGNWDGGNKDKVGVWDPDSRRFYLDMKGDGQWQGESGPTAIDTFKGL